MLYVRMYYRALFISYCDLVLFFPKQPQENIDHLISTRQIQDSATPQLTSHSSPDLIRSSVEIPLIPSKVDD